MKIHIHWLRKDLRVHDNIGLNNNDLPVLPLYVSKEDTINQAGKLWLYEALFNLNRDLDNNLNYYESDFLSALEKIKNEYEIVSISWSRRYEPNHIKQDANLKQRLKDLGYNVKSYNSNLLFEPHTVGLRNDKPYMVFTPYFKKASQNEILQPSDEKAKQFVKSKSCESLPTFEKVSWQEKMLQAWDISEQGANNRLDDFINEGLTDYKVKRNNPGLKSVSKLSPYLHWGMISPRYVWHKIKNQDAPNKDIRHYLSELGWREFAYYMLYHFPNMNKENIYDFPYPWEKNDELLTAWKFGNTGFPLIDAAMKELTLTGYMHNRCRMLVGSFLTNILNIHWQEGAKWFADRLFDADEASNNASWQWVAGCGTDSKQFLRIFNPTIQQQKFDPDFSYIKKYIPDFDKDNYLKPIVDFTKAQNKANKIFESIQSNQT